MAYKSVIDLTSRGQAAAREDGPIAAPFAAPDPAVPEATPESLPDTLQEGLRGLGWTRLMPVQAAAIPHVLAGRDLIVQSRTGSGKTGAFLLPMLDRLDPASPTAQALVLCPTRELARQIFDEFERMNAGVAPERKLRGVAVYGGTTYGPQLDAFKKGAHLVIGTPGRVLDHLERGTLRLDALRVLVLDEADEMLSMGFYPDMKTLRRYLPKGPRASYMFSATMPAAVQRVGREFLTEPSFLSLAGGTVHVDAMVHRYYPVSGMEKDRALVKVIEMENPASAIVFANTRREVDYLAQFLGNYGYDVAGLSSDLSQSAREAVMNRLRKGKLRFLIATDVAARGIDISDLSHVFQYDVPQDREYYVHRAGRTARAGKAGVAVTFATPADEKQLLIIARKYDLAIEKMTVPTDDEVAARVGERLTVMLEDRLRAKTNLERERLGRFVAVARQLVEEGEPELLAMLLDEAYRETLHAPAAEAVADEPEADEAAPEATTGDAPPKKKRRKKRRGAGEAAPAVEAAG